ncbi:MAG: RNA methyltransferase [Neisseria sp.]|nr:RNA methyltransferase [Neisseria sp.]
MISSPDNPHIKHLRQLLTQAKARRRHRQTVLEGVHLLQAALNADRLPEKVFVPHSQTDNAEIKGCLKAVDAARVVLIDDKIAAQIGTLSQGANVLSLIDILPAPTVQTNIDCVLLENIQDPGNVGTILRSAAATGIKYVLTDKHCADLWSPKVLRAAMGAHFGLHLSEGVDLIAFLQSFSGSLHITTLTHATRKSLYELNLQTLGAWVFGNEGAGVSPELAACAPYGVTIPMDENTESLNVAMAASVCLFEQMRQRLP